MRVHVLKCVDLISSSSLNTLSLWLKALVSTGLYDISTGNTLYGIYRASNSLLILPHIKLVCIFILSSTKISVNIEISEDIGVGVSKVDVDSNDFDRFTYYSLFSGYIRFTVFWPITDIIFPVIWINWFIWHINWKHFIWDIQSFE